MFTQKRIVNFLILVIALSFLLVGCVLPFSSVEDEATPTADPNQGGGIDQPAVESSEEQPVVEEAAQPEVEVAEETAVTTEETAVEETTTETTPAAPTTETSQTETTTETEPAESTTTETTTTTETQTTEQTTQESDITSQTSPAAPTTATCPVTHTVRAGENLYRIGLQYGMSWVPIANANGLANPNAINVGQVLTIPVAGCTPVPPTPPADGTTYVVQPGDNLFRIGLKFGISWVQIAEANGIVNPNQIYVGQVLKIPVAQPGPTPNFTHLVRRGETLYSISIHYGVPWQAIAAANQIPPPYIVYTGQTIIIPGSW